MAKVVLLAGAIVRMCFGCPFGGGFFEDLPPGHPRVNRPSESRRLSNGAWYFIHDPSQTDHSKWTDLWRVPPADTVHGNSNASNSVSFQLLVYLSQINNDAEICYWSWQTLPGPQMRDSEANATVSDEDVNLWFTAPADNIGSNDDNYMDHAGQRMQAMITPGGPVVWQQGTVGRILRNRACAVRINGSSDFGDHADCGKPAVTNMQLTMPTATVILKVQASKANESWDMMVKWRSNKTHGHYDEMNSNLVWVKGWGGNGQIVSKAVLCSDIPDRYQYKNLYKGDILAPSGTQTWADEGFDTWKSLCNLLKPDNCTSNASTTGATMASSSTGSGNMGTSTTPTAGATTPSSNTGSGNMGTSTTPTAGATTPSSSTGNNTESYVSGSANAGLSVILLSFILLNLGMCQRSAE